MPTVILFAGQDINDGGWTGSASPSELTWSSIDISGYTSLSLSGDFASTATDKIDNGDNVHVQYRIDSGSWTNLLWFENDGSTYNTYFLEDTDFDGTGDGTQLSSTFATFSKSITETGSTLDIRITVAVESGGEDIAFDNFVVSGTASTGVDNPSDFTATATATDQIDLSWTLNGSSNDVMVVFDLDGSFTDPVDGETYSGSALGGTVIYQGSAESYNHTSLSANTAYYYKAWSVDASNNYSAGVTADATTPKSEPSNHAASFSCSADDHQSITLNWGDNDGTQPADGFLVGFSTNSGSTFEPVDGTPVADTDGPSDWTRNVEHGVETVTITGLDAETQYYAKIWSYTNSGDNIDYKTDGTVPTASATTTEVPPSPTEGDIYISEVCDDDAGGYETAFMEIYNNTSNTIDMENSYIQRWQSGSYDSYTYTFGSGVTIPANGFLIVTRGESDQAQFETDWSVDLDALNSNYDAGHTSLFFTTGRGYKLYNSSDVLLDQTDGDVADSKRDVQMTIGDWTKGQDPSLGNPGSFDVDQALPISLASFTADYVNGAVKLCWETASETENLAFRIYRDGEQIAELEGAGTTSEPQSYAYTDNYVIPGKTYNYVLADVDLQGKETRHPEVEVEAKAEGIAQDYNIGAAYPNPFNPVTMVPLNLAKEANVHAQLYDMLGRPVQELHNGTLNAGSHDLKIDGANLSTGIYFVHVNVNNVVNVQKIALMK
ncbi:MAG: lamin tail domain-containing protein [Candidatus Marinimicrobia bacterium]|nr:lamin tail domain-containing protein [Candidatus Neomarinimicrobiota bacterium]